MRLSPKTNSSPGGEKLKTNSYTDIKNNPEAVDPYGNLHQIPLTSDIKINTQKIRKIKVIEIK